ncbi:MAG: hypothetical protein ICV54_16585 [Nostoc sp. C3-bin3]|nr:hypothetical protein [Nostoc sp. C3-bin3]
MNSYSSEVEAKMQRLYQSLSEKDRRRYAAIEALKLGWGELTTSVNYLGVMTTPFGLG